MASKTVIRSILARCSQAKIQTMARPNEPDMLPKNKCSKVVRFFRYFSTVPNFYWISVFRQEIPRVKICQSFLIVVDMFLQFWPFWLFVCSKRTPFGWGFFQPTCTAFFPFLPGWNSENYRQTLPVFDRFSSSCFRKRVQKLMSGSGGREWGPTQPRPILARKCRLFMTPNLVPRFFSAF